MIAGKTWREIRVMAFAYLMIMELLAIPVILWWPDIYDDLQKSVSVPFSRDDESQADPLPGPTDGASSSSDGVSPSKDRSALLHAGC